jgi:hypothetical protein
VGVKQTEAQKYATELIIADLKKTALLFWKYIKYITKMIQLP